MREIGGTPLLTPDEEIELAARIKAGDEEARQIMIRSNLRLVVKIARDYARLGLPLLDLISEGNIGLMKAVERFDPSKGGKLSTYAAWWIKQTIKRALANQSKTIRLPTHIVDKIRRMRKKEMELSNHLGRMPTNEELAAAVDVKPGIIEHWRTVSKHPASLDAPIGDEYGSSFGEIVGDTGARTPYEILTERLLQEDIDGLIAQLEPREREILRYRFGLQETPPETLEDVGLRFEITRERVRQIQNTAVRKLRALLDEKDRASDEPVEEEDTPDNQKKGRRDGKSASTKNSTTKRKVKKS